MIADTVSSGHEWALPDKRRLEAVLRHELPDRVPHFEVLVENPTLRHVMGRDVPGDCTYTNIDPADYLEFVTRIGQDAIGMCFSCSPFRQVDEAGTLHPLSSPLRTKDDLERLTVLTSDFLDHRFALLDRYVRTLEGTKVGLYVTMADFLTDTYTYLFGFENFMYILMDNRELVEAVLDLHVDFQVAVAERLMDYPLTFFYPADDLAYKSSTLVHPDLLRELWVPRMRRIFAPALARGVPIVFHSDGNIEELIPDLLEMGISVLNPLEPYGMDIRTIKRRYGANLTLMGNMDVGGALSSGTPEQVREEARQLIEEIGQGGNYILASCHSITANVRPDNFLAMVGAAHTYGRY